MANQQSLNELALFAGAGGGILGGHLLGWQTVCAVEWGTYPASVLCARQNDGLLPTFPIWDDVQTFDGKPWRGIVDVVSGGFPCQDISAAGKGAGLEGARSGMWHHMARVVGEVRPRFVFVENSPMLTSRGGTRVIGDLAKMGYDCRWTVMGAADVGANHKRDRIWIVGKLADSKELFCNGVNDNSRISLERKTQSESGNGSGKKTLANSNNSGVKRWEQQPQVSNEKRDLANSRCELWTERDTAELDAEAQVGTSSAIHNQSGGERQDVSNSDSTQFKRMCKSERIQQEYSYASDSRWWETEPDVGRMVNGLASGMDRLKAIGNGQVPLCAATAWRLLTA